MFYRNTFLNTHHLSVKKFIVWSLIVWSDWSEIYLIEKMQWNKTKQCASLRSPCQITENFTSSQLLGTHHNSYEVYIFDEKDELTFLQHLVSCYKERIFSYLFLTKNHSQSDDCSMDFFIPVLPFSRGSDENITTTWCCICAVQNILSFLCEVFSKFWWRAKSTVYFQYICICVLVSCKLAFVWFFLLSLVFRSQAFHYQSRWHRQYHYQLSAEEHNRAKKGSTSAWQVLP